MKKLLIAACFLFPFVASAQTFTRNLYIGLSGTDVSALQAQLRDLGFYTYPSVTGWYGPVTAQAVSRFQQAYAADILIPNGLSAPTGTFGPATRAKLASLIAGGGAPSVPVATPQPASSSFTLSRSLYRGSEGADVLALQNFLKSKGYLAAEPNSYFGPATEAAVKAFQAAQGIVSVGTPDTTGYGAVGPATRGRLNALLAQTTSSSQGGTSSTPSFPSSSSRTSQRAAGGSRTTPGQAASGTGSSGSGAAPSAPASGGSSGGSNGGNVPPSTSQPPARPGTIIPAGSGFSGPTSQPQAIGSGTGADAKAIARWDVVPYQTFDSTFNVGVVAFHMNDIDRVEFSANGGPWVSVDRMTRNPQTDVVEYWATLRASDFPDGPVEVRAVAYPKKGIPRVLQGMGIQANGEHSIFLNANSKGSLPQTVRWVSPDGDNSAGDGSEARPFKTILHALWTIHHAQGGKADNGIIYLKAGDYAYSGGATGFGFGSPVTKNGWITITAAPGTARDEVRIITGGSSERINTSLIRLKNVTLSAGLVTSGNLNQQSHLWWDNCMLEGKGQTINTGFENGFSWTFLTDSIVKNVMGGPTGLYISRHNSYKSIGSDPMQNVSMVLFAEVDGIYRGETAAHPDILQYQGGGTGVRENRIFWGIQSKNVRGSQGIFLSDIGSIKDIAIVGNQIQAGNNTIGSANPGHHVLLWHNTFSHNVFIGAAHQLAAGLGTNWSVKNNYFHQLLGGAENAQAGNVFDNNHYAIGNAVGSKASTGDAAFVDVAKFDFRPGPNSPLLSRITIPLIPNDAEGNVLREGDSIGALRSPFKASAASTVSPLQNTPVTPPPAPSAQPNVPTPTPVQAETDITSGLVLRYQFDESVQDASGSNNHGAILGNPTYVTGRQGSAINFVAGNKGIITFSGTPNTTSHALAFWMKSDMTNPGTVLGRTNGVAIQVRFFNNNIRYGTVNAGAVDVPAGVTTGGWNHFVISRENTQIMIYKNGALLGQGTLSGNSAQGFNEIGVNGAGNSFYTGLLDDLRIYNRALSASEVQALYNQ